MKKAYDILRNLYGKSPMEEIVKFKSELNAIGDKHDFYNIVWDEAFHVNADDKPETIRIVNNTIILSSIWAYGPFETIDDEGLEINAVKMYHYLHQFLNKCIDLDLFYEKREFLWFSNELLIEFFESDNCHPEDLTTENLFTIIELHDAFLNKVNSLLTSNDHTIGNGHFFSWSSNGILLKRDDKLFFETNNFTHDLRIPVTLYVFAIDLVFRKHGEKILNNSKLKSDTIIYFRKHRNVYENLSEEEFQDNFQTFIYNGETYNLGHKKKVSYFVFLNSIFEKLMTTEFLSYDAFGEEDITNFITKHLKFCFSE